MKSFSWTITIIGFFLAIVGSIKLIIEFNKIDTTPTTRVESVIRFTDYGAIEVPVIVQNKKKYLFDINNPRDQEIIISGIMLLVGAGLCKFGLFLVNINESPDYIVRRDIDGLVACPMCAERIQPKAIKCRFCNTEIIKKTQSIKQNMVTSKHDPLKKLVNLIGEGKSTLEPLEVYQKALNMLGGSIECEGSFIKTYIIKLNDSEFRTNNFVDLHKWFMVNIAPLAKD